MPNAETLHNKVFSISKTRHEDVDLSVSSGTVHLSFYWRPSFDFEFLRIIKKWRDSIQYSPAHRSIPSFILMGFLIEFLF